MKKYKFVIVEWDDASSMSHWQTQESLNEWVKDGAYKCLSTGWLVREDKEFYIVCARMSNDDQYGLCEKLPKQMITKIKYIKLK